MASLFGASLPAWPAGRDPGSCDDLGLRRRSGGWPPSDVTTWPSRDGLRSRRHPLAARFPWLGQMRLAPTQQHRLLRFRVEFAQRRHSRLRAEGKTDRQARQAVTEDPGYHQMRVTCGIMSPAVALLQAYQSNSSTVTSPIPNLAFLAVWCIIRL